MLKLYRFPGATCAGKVLLALAEKGVAFEDVVLAREDLVQDWYRALNPQGVVPTIVHAGHVVIESSVILNYIEDAFIGPALRPADALARARMNHWLRRADDALGSIGIVTYALFVRQGLMTKSVEEFEVYYAAIPQYDKRVRLRSVIELGLESPLVPAAVQEVMDLQRLINAATEPGGFLADDYSLADAALTPLVTRIADLALLATDRELPGLHRWWTAVRARSSYNVAISRPAPTGLITAMRAAASAQSDRLSAICELSVAPSTSMRPDQRDQEAVV